MVMNENSIIKTQLSKWEYKKWLLWYFCEGWCIYIIGITGKETDLNYSVLEHLLAAWIEQNVSSHKQT